MKQITKRSSALLLSLLLLGSKMSTIVSAAETGNSQTADSVTVSGPSLPEEVSGNAIAAVPLSVGIEGSGSLSANKTIYFGGGAGGYTTASGGPGMEWVVLEEENGEAWLFAKDVLYSGNTLLGKIFNVNSNGAYMNQWSTSDLCGWLNGKYLTNGFTELEQSAINATEYETYLEKEEAYGGTQKEPHESKIFLLDYEDVRDGGKAAGYRSASAHWWLRSPGSNFNHAAFVYSGGGVNGDGDLVYIEYSYYGIRPAFKLNLSSVLFTSDTSGVSVKSSAAAGGGLHAAQAVAASKKLTLLDTAQNLEVYGLTSGSGSQKLTFSYNAAAAVTGANQYLSCVLTDGGGEVKYYGKLEDLAVSAGGTAELPLADVPPGAYTLKLFTEQANADYDTDYAGRPFELEILVTDAGAVPADTTQPVVSSIIPRDGDTAAAGSGRIEITFSEKMNPQSAGSVTLTGGPAAVAASGVWSDDHKTYTIGYTGLAYGTQYTISLSGFRDVAGNAIAAGTKTTFTTAPQSAGPQAWPVTLNLTAGRTGTINIALGQSGNRAAQAEVNSANPGIAAVSPALLTSDGAVTVTGIAPGSTTISVAFSGGTAAPVASLITVNVTALPPVTDPGSAQPGGSGTGSTDTGSTDPGAAEAGFAQPPGLPAAALDGSGSSNASGGILRTPRTGDSHGDPLGWLWLTVAAAAVTAGIGLRVWRRRQPFKQTTDR